MTYCSVPVIPAFCCYYQCRTSQRPMRCLLFRRRACFIEMLHSSLGRKCSWVSGWIETQQIVWLYNLCFRMAGMFDIDLETEDISDTEVCIPWWLIRLLMISYLKYTGMRKQLICLITGCFSFSNVLIAYYLHLHMIDKRSSLDTLPQTHTL